MIQVALNGGLGNQLFQYAAAKALSKKQNTDLVFDLIPLYSKLQIQNKATFRRYELDVFSIHAKANKPLLTNKYSYPVAKAHYFFHKFQNKIRYNYYKEKSLAFDNKLLNQPDNTYLDGHFQTEKYFKDIEDIIREELVFKTTLTAINLSWKQKIQACTSVSIHIRRSDYILLQKNLNKHGATSLDYYRDAINFISQKINQPNFFIFTDDIAWTKENFKIEFPFEIIDNNNTPESGYIDMQLMSLCKHNIIANSTFSWWAAWLNNNKEKIVIAPQNWFVDKSLNSSDIIPDSWIKL